MDKQNHKEHAARAADFIKEINSEMADAGLEVNVSAPAEKKPGERQESKADDDAKKLSELSDQLLRLHAEFDNYKKRTVKEKEQLAHQSEARLMLRLLPVYEELKLAEAEAAKVSDEAVKQGILLVLAKLRSTFEKEGLQEMKLEGEKFDPFRHETALRVDSDAPEGTIVNAIQKGYFFRGEVLRHAMVSVSSGKAAGKEEKK